MINIDTIMTTEKVRTTIYLPKDLKEKIEEAAKKDKRSFTNYIQVSLEKVVEEESNAK